MVASTTTILVGLLLAFIYLVVYRKNRLMGNIFYILTGLGIMWKFTDAQFVGLLIIIASVVSLLYDLFSEYRR